jgi:hypothetical protein
MKTAKILEFPYLRIRQEPEAHTAKILPMPRPGYPAGDILALPMVFAAAWLSAFGL